ncbi:MAG: MFS transporter [Proteobacteria bacterium]|nr:MFS transporter [Pseudomonadota bacterium]
MKSGFWSAWAELGRLPRRVWVVTSAALINRMGTMAIPFLTLYLTRSLGWSATRAASIVTLYGAVSLVVGPPAGGLSDRIGTRRLMVATLALSGVSMLLFPLVRTYAAVAAMTVLFSALTESFRPANMTAISEGVAPERRKQAYALHRAAVNLGMSVGPALGGFLATVSFPLIWIVDGLSSLAAAALLAFFLEESRVEAPREEPGKADRWVMADPKLVPCLIGAVLVSAVFFQHDAALPLHLVHGLRFSERFFGLLFTVNTLLIVALEIPLNHATADWPHRRTLALGAMLFALGFGGYAFCRTAAQVVASTVVWTFGEMILFPGMTAYVSAVSPPARRGAYMGVYVTAFSVGFTIGPWPGAYVLEHFGPTTLWAACFIVAALGAVALARVSEEKSEA